MIVVAYYCYFVLFFQYLSNKTPKESYRQQSIVSFLAAIFLAPYSLWEALVFFRNGSISNVIRHQVHLFYLVYCFADFTHSRVYYPNHFKLLDGYLHHGVTGGYVLYELIKNELRPCCLAMIVEVPSFLLFASRIFKENLIIQFYKKHLFPYLFVFCRIIVLGMYTLKCYLLGEVGKTTILIYILFTIVNIHWFALMFKRTN